MPLGTPCRVGYHAGWDTMPGGICCANQPVERRPVWIGHALAHEGFFLQKVDDERLELGLDGIDGVDYFLHVLDCEVLKIV